MTPSSCGFNTHIISVHQMRGKCRRELPAVAMFPTGEKGEARQGRLAAQALLQAAGTEQGSHGATLPLPGRQERLLGLKASTEVPPNQTKVLFIKLHNS